MNDTVIEKCRASFRHVTVQSTAFLIIICHRSRSDAWNAMPRPFR